MRSVINISVPSVVKEAVEKEVKDGGFASTSEFFRHLLRMWKDQEILRDVKQSEKEFAEGKGIRLRSLSDLDK